MSAIFIVWACVCTLYLLLYSHRCQYHVWPRRFTVIANIPHYAYWIRRNKTIFPTHPLPNYRLFSILILRLPTHLSKLRRWKATSYWKLSCTFLYTMNCIRHVMKRALQSDDPGLLLPGSRSLGPGRCWTSLSRLCHEWPSSSISTGSWVAYATWLSTKHAFRDELWGQI